MPKGMPCCPYDGLPMCPRKCRDCVDLDHIRGERKISCFASKQRNDSKTNVALMVLVKAERPAVRTIRIADEHRPYDRLAREDFLRVLASVLETLPERDRIVLTVRFGLGGEPPKTLNEAGAALGITGVRVRQIEERALRRLRHPSRIRHLVYEKL